jgi:hypothetical protein
MKQQINEIKRMQQLAGILNESHINENQDLTINVDALKRHDLPSDEEDVKELTAALKGSRRNKNGLAYSVFKLIDMVGMDVSEEEVSDVYGVSKEIARDAIEAAMGEGF